MLMKARFFALVALVLGMASCAKDFAPEVQVGGEVDFTLSVAAPELTATRADADGLNGHDSAYGAIDYLTDADWENVDLRYILEVYDVADSYVDAKPIKDRMVKVFDKYEPTTFELRLIPNRDYHFVVFADFVEQGASAVATVDAQENTGKRHIIGETLADIRIKDIADYEAENKVAEKFLNNEYSDAYFGVMNYNPKHGTHNNNTKDNGEPLTLKRPYAKVRVVATDLHEVNLNVEPKSVAVNYTAKRPMAFNALTGKISVIDESVNRVYDREYAAISKEEGGLQNHYYNAGYDANKAENLVKNDADVYRQKYMTLFTDYILATDSQSAIQFTMSVYGDGGLIKSTSFNTQIPVQRNHLTTIIGNVLTTATEVDVRIDDNFVNEYTDAPFYVEIWDGKSMKEPKFDDVTKSYYVWRPSELAWIANEVNVNGDNLKGINVEQMADLDLNCEYWTPIGAGKSKDEAFRGTYNGNGFAIHGLHVDNVEAAGLFGFCSGNINDVTLVEPWIVTNHYAGGIAGWFQAIDSNANNRISINNCKVLGGTITCNVDANKDNGDKAGAIAGYVLRGDVTNCEVERVRVTAYRDLGGIVGYANYKSTVTGNTIKSSYIVADWRVDYSQSKPVNAHELVGYIAADAVVSDNEYKSGPNVVNGDDVRVVLYADSIDDIKANGEKILVLPAGEYNFTETTTAKTMEFTEGVSVINANKNELKVGDANNYGIIAEGAETSLVINDASLVAGGGGISVGDGAKLVFNGEKIKINSSATAGRYVAYASGKNSVIVINDGVFSFETGKVRRAYVYCAADATVYINGGTFGKPSTRSGYTAGIMTAAGGKVIITGGTFGFDPTEWVDTANYNVDKVGSNWVVSAK